MRWINKTGVPDRAAPEDVNHEPIIIERRWSPRLPLDISASLHVDGLIPHVGRILNIGMVGTLIEARTEWLPHKRQIYLSFTLRDIDGANHHRLPVRLVWDNNHQAGLMFSSFNFQTARLLRELLDILPR